MKFKKWNKLAGTAKNKAIWRNSKQNLTHKTNRSLHNLINKYEDQRFASLGRHCRPVQLGLPSECQWIENYHYCQGKLCCQGWEWRHHQGMVQIIAMISSEKCTRLLITFFSDWLLEFSSKHPSFTALLAFVDWLYCLVLCAGPLHWHPWRWQEIRQ